MASVRELLGETLTSHSGEVKTETIIGPDRVVGIYFSAHWCPPCRGFTPVLVEYYNKLKKSDKTAKLEIVFVSSDRDEASFKEYFGEMPWLALPFENREGKQKVAEKFNVTGIPMFVIMNGATGEVITRNGRGAVAADEDGDDFPDYK